MAVDDEASVELPPNVASARRGRNARFVLSGRTPLYDQVQKHSLTQ
jgi:hypothetical protein